jgi:hypothetical protein
VWISNSTILRDTIALCFLKHNGNDASSVQSSCSHHIHLLQVKVRSIGLSNVSRIIIQQSARNKASTPQQKPVPDCKHEMQHSGYTKEGNFWAVDHHLLKDLTSATMYVIRGWDSSVGIANCYWLDSPDSNPDGGEILGTGPGEHRAFYRMGTGSFPGVYRPERCVDYPPTSSAEVKEITGAKFLLPLWAFVARSRVNYVRYHDRRAG